LDASLRDGIVAESSLLVWWKVMIARIQPLATMHLMKRTSLVVALATLLPVFPARLWGDTPLRGTVTGSNGQPVAGVIVYGSRSSTCCPFRRDETMTGQDGKYQLEHPGIVVHFVKDGLEPRTLVVQVESPSSM